MENQWNRLEEYSTWRNIFFYFPNFINLFNWKRKFLNAMFFPRCFLCRSINIKKKNIGSGNEIRQFFFRYIWEYVLQIRGILGVWRRTRGMGRPVTETNRALGQHQRSHERCETDVEHFFFLFFTTFFFNKENF